MNSQTYRQLQIKKTQHTQKLFKNLRVIKLHSQIKINIEVSFLNSLLSTVESYFRKSRISNEMLQGIDQMNQIASRQAIIERTVNKSSGEWIRERPFNGVNRGLFSLFSDTSEAPTTTRLRDDSMKLLYI